jgi:hypothetical protein
LKTFVKEKRSCIEKAYKKETYRVPGNLTQRRLSKAVTE